MSRVDSRAKLKGDEMKSHTFNGQSFKVTKGTSHADADKFCAALLTYQSRAKGEQGETYYEVDRMPEDFRASETPRKGRGRPRKVSAPIPAQIAGEGHTATVESTPDSSLYVAGCYREACRVCGKGIQRTGKRGRAPIYHEECRPTE